MGLGAQVTAATAVPPMSMAFRPGVPLLICQGVDLPEAESPGCTTAKFTSLPPQTPEKTPPHPGVSLLLLLPSGVGEGDPVLFWEPRDQELPWKSWSISAPPPPGCVTLGKSLYLSEPAFPLL